VDLRRIYIPPRDLFLLRLECGRRCFVLFCFCMRICGMIIIVGGGTLAFYFLLVALHQACLASFSPEVITFFGLELAFLPFFSSLRFRSLDM
jgi:hypothetical protein